MNPSDKLCTPICLEEDAGLVRVNEPVTIGVPFPKGATRDPDTVFLSGSNGTRRPLQTKILARWCDGSVKWLLLDFQASAEANSRAQYTLHCSEAKSETLSPLMRVSVWETEDQVTVDTGRAVFVINRRLMKPLDQVTVQGLDCLAGGGSSFILVDEHGEQYVPHVCGTQLETVGPLRVTIRVKSELMSVTGKVFANCDLRASFYAGSRVVELQATLHNPRAASHPGGLWDLGDQGSIYFTDFSLRVPLEARSAPVVHWSPQPTQLLKASSAVNLELYQESSGGDHWQSNNHVNRFGRVPHTFRGYRVTVDGSLAEEGCRATPIVAVDGERGRICGTVSQFWQNFPKALGVCGNELVVRLFPGQYPDLFELQGGEQKTHAFYLQFDGVGERETDLAWVHRRLWARATPQWYARTKACSYLTPTEHDENPECRELIETAITGPASFFARREIIDEYGWRNFGDLYADHEAVGHVGKQPLVAHYNNQYDVIYGALVEYLRGSDSRWSELARDLARHVIDIDIYHTDLDRPAYNGGLFWHTDHYLDAATATHRAYSRANATGVGLNSYGGGPSNEHNYTSGLLYYYYLTGDEAAREAVEGLANWVLSMDDGSTRRLGFVDRRPTGLCSSTASKAYHGPGRGAGNSINALLDVYVLSSERAYLDKAEEIIRRCIHPADNIQSRRLDDPERRWSYLVFLQILAKYLDCKIADGAIDAMYGYAQASLLHYGEWMLEHEIPYATVLDKVELPTETWPAQDIRKSVVLHCAEKHACEPLRSRFRTRAEFFFEASIKDLRTFATCRLTRPLILLLTNAYIHPYFQEHPEEAAPRVSGQTNYGHPERFTPQFGELYRVREKAAALRNLVHGYGKYVRGILHKKTAPGVQHG